MIEAIVLAAGKGERMGAIKPLVPIVGIPALARVISSVRAAGVKGIIVVLGYAAEQIEAAIDLTNCRVVRNKDYESGMGSSLAVGIHAVSPRARGALLMHADMPYITPETIQAVIARVKQGDKIVAPRFRGKRGFPVYLRRDTFLALIPTLVGEVGARAYIAQHRDELVVIDVDDPGAVWDIDRPEEIELGVRESGTLR